MAKGKPSYIRFKDDAGEYPVPRGLTFCAKCRFIVKPTGAAYIPHPESVCSTEGKLNFVTGEKDWVLCKDRNKKGDCCWFEGSN
jgi:hypothetical protein